MIPPKRISWCTRRLIICCATVTIANSNAATNDKIIRLSMPGGRAVVEAVDWYKPLPDTVYTRGWATIYNDVTLAVPERLHHEAAGLLGNADFVELTKEQAKHFGFRTEPDAVLRSLMRKSKQSLAAAKGGRNPYESPTKHDTALYLEAKQSSIDEYTAEIKRYQKWMGRLKPYLIKSVAIQETHDYLRVRKWREDFDGILGSKDLVIYFGSPRVIGDLRFKMIRMPVVAYLPVKPRHVYTEITVPPG
jgi:hypothetical protein